MLRWKLAAGLTVGLAVTLMAGCGKENNTTVKPIQRGALYTFVGDTPLPDVISFPVTITSMKLRQEGTTNIVDVFPTTANPLSLKKLDFCALRDFSTILDISTVPEVTYDQVTLGMTGGQIIVYDPSKTPPVSKLTIKLSTAAPVIPIQPSLAVTANKVQALRLDFDVLRSIQVDSTGQVTGSVTPIFRASPVIANDAEGFGKFDDLIGFVRSVQPYPTGSFTGAFSLQLLSGSGPAISVSFNSATKLYGVPALNLLETGRVAEVGATIDSNGNVVADTVEVEDRAVVEENKVAMLGLVTSVTRDDAGSVTQFDLFVRQVEPVANLTTLVGSVVEVSVSPTTTLQYSSRPTNFLNPPLPFNARAIAVGQELIVNGQYTQVTDEPTTVAASAIFLKIQTQQGTLGSLAQVSQDGRSGAFWFIPHATMLQGAPILVMTSANTVYVNVLGLAEITPQATLLVRGLPFYQTEATTLRGVVVPAGTLVVTARQVHQLD
jgi:hypothetical protein